MLKKKSEKEKIQAKKLDMKQKLKRKIDQIEHIFAKKFHILIETRKQTLRQSLNKLMAFLGKQERRYSKNLKKKKITTNTTKILSQTTTTNIEALWIQITKEVTRGPKANKMKAEVGK